MQFWRDIFILLFSILPLIYVKIPSFLFKSLRPVLEWSMTVALQLHFKENNLKLFSQEDSLANNHKSVLLWNVSSVQILSTVALVWCVSRHTGLYFPGIIDILSLIFTFVPDIQVFFWMSKMLDTMVKGMSSPSYQVTASPTIYAVPYSIGVVLSMESGA